MPSKFVAARRRLAAAFRPAWRRAAVFLVLGVLAVEVCYLLVANTILLGHLIEDWAKTDDVLLTYDSAYSLYPAHVHVSNFRLRIEDYNVQLELGIAEAKVDVNLFALLNKQFHGSNVRTQGTSFKLRHKVHAVGNDVLRLAAYPPIEGFTDPPLYAGPPPLPAPGESEDWSVRFDDVVAQVKSLWFLEYHYEGAAVATGSFELAPGRSLLLLPATLQIDSGTLQVGDRLMAKTFSGHLRCDILRTDLAETHGVAIFRTISAAFDGKLAGGGVEFLDVYLEPTLGIKSRGEFHSDLHVGMERGVVTSGTEASLVVPKASMTTPRGMFDGDVIRLFFAVPTVEAVPYLRLGVQAGALTNAEPRAPSVRGLRATMDVHPVDVTQPLQMVRWGLLVRELNAPSLAWFEPFWKDQSATHLAGSALLTMDHTGGEVTAPRGKLNLKLSDFDYRDGDTRVRMNADLDAQFEQGGDALIALERFHLSLGRVTLNDGTAETDRWNATVDSNSFKVLSGGARALQGTFDWRVDETKALLPLVLPKVPSAIASTLLGLRTLTARTAVYYGGDLQRIELLDARSGAVRLKGTWQKSKDTARATFLLQHDLLNVGFWLKSGALQVVPGASAQWLANTGF